MTAVSADNASLYGKANALRNQLLLDKLDSNAVWVQHRHPADGGYAISVERRGEDIVKTLRGFMAQLQDHELNAYLAVWKQRQMLPRIATFRRLEAHSHLNHNTIVLRDYGPDLLDWLRLLGPPRLEPGYAAPDQPARRQALGPWLQAQSLLALARALLETLAPFHEAGFVHCDIKPDNFCIRHRLAPGQAIDLDAEIRGELDLDSLAAIDLGCSLLPCGGSYRRVIHRTLQGQPLYIGGTPGKRRDYTWPALFGARNESEARQRAKTLVAGNGLVSAVAVAASKPREIAYVSDHYLMCCELAELGHADVLDRLDWRVDFHSLGHLLRGIIKHLARDREIAAATDEQRRYLEKLPARLAAYDTSPFVPAPPLPHAELIGEIDALIGVGEWRCLPFTLIGNANPLPWFDLMPDTPFTELESEHHEVGETPLREPRQDPGQPFAEFRDFDAAPLLIALPAASAWLGAPPDEPGRSELEPQPYQASIASFALGKYPVSFAEWDAFLHATGREIVADQDQGWGRDRQPVILIDRHDIDAYLFWLNQIAGWEANDPHRYRLPTAQEWEYAARANTRSAYYCGESLRPDQAHFHLRPTPDGLPLRDRPAPVGSYPANPWGFYDVLGNIWEYVEESGCSLVLRGGSWLNGPALLRASACQLPPAGGRGMHIGFRVARSLGRRK